MTIVTPWAADGCTDIYQKSHKFVQTAGLLPGSPGANITGLFHESDTALR